ncbi:DNA/RNA non-specific endonuclease, partial [Acinetobacter sp. 3657]|uniref:DNA/RNA non-specific endonuclease n=1 Tax=Acinetobacter sp. 3657 TaxID=2817764 RepID=UPI0028555687|nr:hypothetical protein [Prolinoborus sp. 3657]
QNALINYDSLNRKMSVQDQSFNIHYEYDANGNIIHMLANYRDAVNAAPKIQDFWYRYDRMNRFEISMGVLNSTTKMVERGATGVEITYDKLGQRTSADYGKDALNSSKAHKESYTYTTDGYIETIKNADYGSNEVLGTSYTISVRHNDALGRVKTYQDYNPNSSSVYQTTNSEYNKDNQIAKQTKVGGTGTGTTTYFYLADKVTLDKTVMTPPSNSGPTQSTQYEYEWWDSAKQKSITTKVNGQEGVTNFSYNVNGHISGFVDEKNTQNKRSATYINNSQGMVLQRNELINNSMNRYRNFYYVNGQRIGDVSNDGPSREDYVQSLQNSRAKPTQAKNFKPISSADFDQNFEPINAQYPSSAPTSYVVSNGDTLQSIALSVWGDSSMWYMIADLNGLSPLDKLTAGQVLTIPNKVTNIHNNSETFRPYSPGEAIGDTQPTIPSPPPPPKPKKKCGGIAQIVMIVVAVVVTIYTAGAAAGLMGAVATTATGTAASMAGVGMAALAGGSAMGVTIGAGYAVAAAAIGAAVGSAASQLAGKAMGVVDSFSWSQVGISALTAGATAGVGGAISSVGTATQAASQSSWVVKAASAVKNAHWAAKGAVFGAINYGSNHIANQVFGNKQSFSWNALGSSVVASIAASGMGASGVFDDALGTTASPYAYALAGANIAGAIEDKWFGGSKPDYLNVSMAAIANTVGRQFAEKADNWFSEKTTTANTLQRPNYLNESIMAKYAHLEGMEGARLISIAGSDERRVVQLDTIVVKAREGDWLGDPNIENALEGVKSFFSNRIAALKQWGNASVPFQSSWATQRINTGNPTLDKYFYQPVNDAVSTMTNTVLNAGRLLGNTATIASNSPVAFFSAVSGDYEASQQFYDDVIASNPATASTLGSVRTGLRYISAVKDVNKAAVVGRTIGSSQRGSASLSLVNDIPVGSTTGEVLTASAPASPIKALYPSTASTQVKAPFVSTASRTLHFDNIDTFNRAANNPTPNTSYKYSGVTWTTDNLSRVSTVEGYAAISPANNRSGIDGLSTTVLGKGPDAVTGDIGFHLWGDLFGGPTNKVNIVPGNGRPLVLSDGTKLKNLNQGRYRADFEIPVAEIFKQTGQKVPVRISVSYGRNNLSTRPDAFVAQYKNADGNWIQKPFLNKAGG